MAKFRNVSGDQRMIPEGSPALVDDGGLFEVPDDRAEAFAEQPWFSQVRERKATS